MRTKRRISLSSVPAPVKNPGLTRQKLNRSLQPILLPRALSFKREARRLLRQLSSQPQPGPPLPPQQQGCEQGQQGPRLLVRLGCLRDGASPPSAADVAAAPARGCSAPAEPVAGASLFVALCDVIPAAAATAAAVADGCGETPLLGGSLAVRYARLVSVPLGTASDDLAATVAADAATAAAEARPRG